MAEIPNALTDLLRGKTPDEIHETLYQKRGLSPAGIEQRGRAIALIREADVEAQRHREHRIVGPTRECYIVGALMGGGYLNAHAKDLLDTITYQPNRDSSTSSRRRTSALRRCADLLRMVWTRIVEWSGQESCGSVAIRIRRDD